MSNPAYFASELLHSLIAEGTPLENYTAGAGHREWNDDEIAAIRAVLKKLTSARILNSNDAEDLVQDTLLTMIAKHRGMVFEKGPLAWGLGILRRKVGNYYRRAQRFDALDEQQANKRAAISACSPEKRVFNEELNTIVDGVLSKIPSSQREAMELLVEGLNAREIAEELKSVSYQNVVNRLYRGRKKLASALMKYGYGPEALQGARKMKRSNGNGRGSGSKKALSA